MCSARGSSAAGASTLAVMYGLDPWATVQNIAVIPLAIQELVFGIWMLAKGFNRD